MDSGDLAAWAAVVIGAVGIVGAWRAYVISRATRQDEIERDRRRQAAAVSGWMGYLYEPGREQTTRCNAIMITNQSDSAIYHVSVRALMNKPPQPCEFRAWVCPPGQFFAAWSPNERKPWDLLSDLATSDYVSRPYTRHPTSWRILELAFTDGSGTRWCRNQRGCLVEIPSTSTSLSTDVPAGTPSLV